MTLACRTLTPELLDELAPDDPQALRSRRDLRKVHRAMGSLSILRRQIRRLGLRQAPRRILELGAGDGTLLLRFAQRRPPAWDAVQVTFVDRHNLISKDTHAAFHSLGWKAEVWQGDALDWARGAADVRYDLCMTTLFLHHFDDDRLARLLRGVADRVGAFIACEPKRNGLAWAGSHLIGALGVNRVTREDAVKSVAAGFRGTEISRLWPRTSAWRVREFTALPFTHCFTAIAGSP